MSSLTEARQALINVLNDRDVAFEFEDRELALDALGMLYEYDDE